MSDIRKAIMARLGIAAKATFGIWGDVPNQYRAAVDFIRKQSKPSGTAMNELKKAIKQRLAYAAQERDPGMRQMYQDDAGSLENALEYAQRGDKATLLRAAYNMETAVRDYVPNEMFIWAGGDVNWSHPNVKAMLERVSRSVGASAPAKRRAMRLGVKDKMAVNRRKVVQDLEYLRDEARRVNDASSRIDAENWLKRVKARDLKEQDWLEAADAVSQISAVLNSRPGIKAKMAMDSRYKVGDTVVARAAVQGMKKGQTYKVTDISMQDTPWGTFFDYQLDGKLWVGNGHLVLDKVNASRAGKKAEMAAEGRVNVDGVEYRVLPYQVDYFKADLAKFDDPKWRKQIVQHYLKKNYIIRASRPGAKVTASKPDDAYRKVERYADSLAMQGFNEESNVILDWLYSVSDASLKRLDPAKVSAAVRAAEREPGESHQRKMAVLQRELSKAVAAKAAMAAPTASKPKVEETEEQKAGLKLMAATDQAVSDKIRTLIKEGKPQDQAVAIALDMKRRGEL